jgi:hypothetical protein
MHKSLRTRLLLSAYRATRDLAYRLHQFAASLQERAQASETKDYEIYLGALDEEHTLLDDVKQDAERRMEEIEEEYQRVTSILEYTPRPQVPPFNEVPHLRVDDLTELPLVDEGEAPLGYKAMPGGNSCTGCHFDPVDFCPNSDGSGNYCLADKR